MWNHAEKCILETTFFSVRPVTDRSTATSPNLIGNFGPSSIVIVSLTARCVSGWSDIIFDIKKVYTSGGDFNFFLEQVKIWNNICQWMFRENLLDINEVYSNGDTITWVFSRFHFRWTWELNEKQDSFLSRYGSRFSIQHSLHVTIRWFSRLFRLMQESHG